MRRIGKACFVAMVACVSSQVFGGTISSYGTYSGQLQGVAAGFFGSVDVGLLGVSCN
jgi:hypothetical protein